MARLQNKKVVITGALGGQGQVACRLFAQEGAQIVASDLDDVAGKEFEATLRAEGHDLTFVAADLSTSAGAKSLGAGAAAALGTVDVLYANHGIILGRPLMETTEAEWDRIQDVNLKSNFLLTQAVVPLMGSGGSIINVSSVGGQVVFPAMSAYGAAKAGLAFFSKVAAVDLAPLGIRVNAICPGVIDTDMPRNFASTLESPEEVLQSFRDGHLVGRMGRAEEVVYLAMYLASDESTFTTGAVITVDGGWSLQ
jgi:NAD(P)-dependent dehydrogenase (short-subunit alcohol dehydrogenase family)